MVRTLQRIKKLAPPRVTAAWLRTLWNGWTTQDRFQQGASSCCVLGCGNGIDSLKHYPFCKVVRNFGRTFLGLQEESSQDILSNFVALGVNLAAVPDDVLVRRAVLVYAVYCSTNQARNCNSRISSDEAATMLQQNSKHAADSRNNVASFISSSFCKEAVSGAPNLEHQLQHFYEEAGI